MVRETKGSANQMETVDKRELVDLETELKKRANEVDVYNGGGNMQI